MLPLFFVFWYLPAYYRTGHLLRPLTYPILCFTVDNFSLLGLHPTPRPARGMYAVAVCRVVILFALIPLCSQWSPVPQGVKDLVINWKALDLFFYANSHQDTVQMAQLWIASSALVLMLSLLWVLITVVLLAGTTFGGQRNDQLLKEIEQIAVEVDRASALGKPGDCRQALEGLASRHPKFQLAGLVGTAGPAWASVLHLVMDIGSAVTLLMHSRLTLAAPMVLSVALSARYLYRRGTGPHSLPQEVLFVLRRGLVTEEYMEAIRSDKGVLRIPETVLKVYALPLSSKSPISILMAMGSIVGNVALVAKFVFTEQDLGVRRERPRARLGKKE